MNSSSDPVQCSFGSSVFCGTLGQSSITPIERSRLVIVMKCGVEPFLTATESKGKVVWKSASGPTVLTRQTSRTF